MTKYLNNLFITTAFIGLSASIPVSAANSFQEVADNNSGVLRIHEKPEIRTKNITGTVPASIQGVAENNSELIRAHEITKALTGNNTVPVSVN